MADCARSFAPPPRLSVSEWADTYITMPKGTSAFPGRWQTSRTPYLREPLDCMSDPAVDGVVAMFASQTGKTMIPILSTLYYIHQDPTNQLIVRPTDREAQEFSKIRLQPMFDGHPALFPGLGQTKKRSKGKTLSLIQYDEGWTALVGANAPSKLASWMARLIHFDEADRYPPSSGGEGSVVEVTLARMTTFWNGKYSMNSSPGNEGESIIDANYQLSSRGHWCVPCPSCGVYQPLDWPRLDFDTSSLACAVCGCLHSEYEWDTRAQQAGMWIHEDPDNPVRGFHLAALASPFPKVNWDKLITGWRAACAKGHTALQPFINTRLAELWSEPGERIDADTLIDHRHHYGCEIPRRVVMITAGVDVQIDRLEMEVAAWGPGYESWGVQYLVLPGEPTKPAVWQALDEVLRRSYLREDGSRLPIAAVCIDSRYATSHVYDFCRTRLARNIFAIKGKGGPGRPDVNTARKAGKNKDVLYFEVGVDTVKDTLSGRLKVKDEGPDYCHWPTELEFDDGEARGYGNNYFHGLTSETRIEHNGAHTWVHRSQYRNEPLDCRVYATAALRIAGKLFTRLLREAAETAAQADGTGAPPAPPRQARRTHSRGVEV